MGGRNLGNHREAWGALGGSGEDKGKLGLRTPFEALSMKNPLTYLDDLGV